MVYPSFKEQNLSPKRFWGQKSPLLLAKSFLGHRRDTEKTPKRHRKDTEKTQKWHRKEKTSDFFSDEAKIGLQTLPSKDDFFLKLVSDVTPTRGSSFFNWFQTSSAEVRPRSQTLPLMSFSMVRSIRNLYFFSTKSLQKSEIFSPKNHFCYYNSSI